MFNSGIVVSRRCKVCSSEEQRAHTESRARCLGPVSQLAVLGQQLVINKPPGRIVNVVLTRCASDEVLPSFARCLEALPNAHTLQVLRAHTQMTTHLKNAFEGRSFPAIQTVILPSHAHNILRCCKEARVVICNFGDGSKLISAIAKECKNVERLEGISPDMNMLKRK